jgi:apolipoprotein D and lipocalin family protein
VLPGLKTANAFKRFFIQFGIYSRAINFAKQKSFTIIYVIMKKEKLWMAAAAGVGLAVIAYKILTRRQIPEWATPVDPFDIDRYMGKWHELARFESRIEKDLKNVTEDYSMNADDTIKVITTGYNYKKHKTVQASGKIKFTGDGDVGMLKVSYFGPFYVNYNVIDIDPDYRHALVCTNNLEYLWVLSRENKLPEEIKTRFINRAIGIGFDVSRLEWV